MSKIVNISEAASLAIHSMALIASGNKMLNVNQIAEVTGASRNHLAKVLQLLVRFDYLSSNRGPKGGFEIKKDPDTITLYEIYQLVEGSPDTTHCGLHTTECPFNNCVFGGLTRKFSSDFVEYLKTKKLSEIKFINQ